MIKCVVWDLDNTLLDGIYLESPDQPPAASPGPTGILAELAGRGILHAIASRNPPEAGQYAERAIGHVFAAIQCGWGTKSDGDQGNHERARPDRRRRRVRRRRRHGTGRGLVPPARGPRAGAWQDMADAAGWPQFSPPVVTDEARRRGELYLQRRYRLEEARAFGGSREEFLRYCQTRVTIGPATRADLPRLHELSVRTHQFNSMGRALSEAEFDRLIRPPRRQAFTVRLTDRFGDDGIVGGCVIVVGPGQASAGSISWSVPLLMMSCRALGRGVIDAQLTWICQAARAAGASQVTLTCLVSPRNVALRVALTGAGFRAAAPDGPAGGPRVARYVRSLAEPLPDLPGWVTVTQ